MNAKSIRTEGARLLCWSTPLGSAKARQRRRQSRFHLMCGAKLVLVKLMNAKSIRTEGARLLCWAKWQYLS
jgi:hypothetical protein